MICWLISFILSPNQHQCLHLCLAICVYLSVFLYVYPIVFKYILILSYFLICMQRFFTFLFHLENKTSNLFRSRDPRDILFRNPEFLFRTRSRTARWRSAGWSGKSGWRSSTSGSCWRKQKNRGCIQGWPDWNNKSGKFSLKFFNNLERSNPLLLNWFKLKNFKWMSQIKM